MEAERKIRYNAVFSKTKELVYISHLDLVTLFRRAIRRSGIPFILSKGFTPRIKISAPRALKLGVESESEEFSFFLADEQNTDFLKKALNRQFPEGIIISSVQKG